MRHTLFTVMLVAAGLAGCATTSTLTDGADRPGPTATPAVATEPLVVAPSPPPVKKFVETPIAKVIVPAFGPDAAAELDPLPLPAHDLWDRIVRGFAVPDLEGPLVEKWERWYAERPDYVARMVDRSRRYLYHIVNEVDQRGMPLDIALLPMVESAFNPQALSSARAAGIWQFIPSTGRHYGLDQTFWVDSRRDVIAATDKALDYLQKLFGDFNDWQLALAAYNWGEGNVARALERNRARGKPEAYEALAMPDETRNYLPKLQALKNIVRDPEKYGLLLADVPDAPYFTAVRVSRKMDVKRAAELAELPVEEFLALNPQHNRPVIAGADEFTILLPIDRAEVFAAKLDLQEQPLVSWQAYRMKQGESLNQIAARYGMSVETLRAVNGIGSRARLHGGHVLLVPAERDRSESADASLQRAVFTAVPQGRTFYHTVRRGETLSSIARRYGVTVRELRSWNGLPQATLRIGQQIRVTSDVVVASSPHGRTHRAVATSGARAIKSPAAAKAAQPASARSGPGGQRVSAGSAKSSRPAARAGAEAAKPQSTAVSPAKSTSGTAARAATAGAVVTGR